MPKQPVFSTTHVRMHVRAHTLLCFPWTSNFLIINTNLFPSSSYLFRVWQWLWPFSIMAVVGGWRGFSPTLELPPSLGEETASHCCQPCRASLSFGFPKLPTLLYTLPFINVSPFKPLACVGHLMLGPWLTKPGPTSIHQVHRAEVQTCLPLVPFLPSQMAVRSMQLK